MSEETQSSDEIRRLAEEASQTDVPPEAKGVIRQLEEHRPLSADELVRAVAQKRVRKLLPAMEATGNISATNEREAADELDRQIPKSGTSLENK